MWNITKQNQKYQSGQHNDQNGQYCHFLANQFNMVSTANVFLEDLTYQILRPSLRRETFRKVLGGWQAEHKSS